MTPMEARINQSRQRYCKICKCKIIPGWKICDKSSCDRESKRLAAQKVKAKKEALIKL